MRSRDGNHYLSLRLRSIIFILCSLASLNASEYLISYRYTIKNLTLYNDSLLISKSMKKCTGKPQKKLILENTTNGNFKKLIHENNEEFLDFIHKLGLHVEHNEVTTNLQNKHTTVLTLKTTCFKVDFNDNFAIIAPLK